MAGEWNVVVRQGADLDAVLSDVFLPGEASPFDFDTAGFLRQQVRGLPGGQVVADWDDGDEWVLDGGTATLHVGGAVTANLTPGAYRHDVLLEDGAGARFRLLEGNLTVVAAITEAPSV